MSTAPPYGSLPPGRGRWRLTLHNRPFTPTSWQNTIIAQLDTARSRSLTQQWNQPAQLAFTLDGHSPEAKLVQELTTEVIAWRWAEPPYAQDQMVFRGVVDHSEDELSENTMTTNYVCHDYAALWQRRYNTAAYTVTQRDQDLLVADFAYMASTVSTSSGTALTPGSFLPLTVMQVNPNNTIRAAQSGQLRDRTYPPQTQVFEMLADLANVISGFDWAVQPYRANNMDALAVFYPQQGVARTDMVLQYGSTVSSLTRTVSSDDYANYVRVLGNNGSSVPTAAQFYSERWNTDANNVTVNPVGLWMNADNAADVVVQSTLNDQAAGDLALYGTLVPSYTAAMRPGAYSWANPNMGDTVPLIVNAGRLNVNTSVRVLGISYDVGDDGDEDVTLTVGRPATSLVQLLTQADRDVDALTRR